MKTQKERQEMFVTMAHALYKSEQNGKTWLLRPAFMEGLLLLYNAWQNQEIHGAFVYSNNGSANLVRFVALWMNVCIQQLLQLESVPPVFQMAIWSNAPCRQPYGMAKSFASIQTCLRAHGLPECSSIHDLLFFDDMPHVLENEIPYYVKVSPYFNHTPAMLVIEALSSIQNKVTCIQWTTIANKSLDQQIHDFKRPDNRYIMKPQSKQEYNRDIAMYRKAFYAFLHNSPAFF
jgi:uncharacterized membrane protein